MFVGQPFTVFAEPENPSQTSRQLEEEARFEQPARLQQPRFQSFSQQQPQLNSFQQQQEVPRSRDQQSRGAGVPQFKPPKQRPPPFTVFSASQEAKQQQSVFAQIRSSIETSQRFRGGEAASRPSLKNPLPLATPPPPHSSTIPLLPPPTKAVTEATTTTIRTTTQRTTTTTQSKHDLEVKMLEEKMKTKMDSVIDKMEDIIEKKKKPEKEGKVRGIDEENIENLVRKIVFEALEKPEEKPVPLKKDEKNNLNALDATIENLHLESYSGGNEVNEEEEPDVKKSIKPTAKKEKGVNKIKSDFDTQPSLDTEDLVDKIVESIFPLVSKLGSVQRHSDEDEIDDEVGVMMTTKSSCTALMNRLY